MIICQEMVDVSKCTRCSKCTQSEV